MDDFRVGSVPLENPYRHEPADADRRRRRHRPEGAPQDDDVVELGAAGQDGDLDIQDVYTPSERNREDS